MARYTATLDAARDIGHGAQVFREKCANCHVAHGVGLRVGPDLTAEFQRAEEAIVRDILAPNETIASGYATYVIETTEGQIVSGLIMSESASSVTLRQPGGQEQTVLRKNIELLKAAPVSLMPEELARTLTPQEIADVIAWLRSPPLLRSDDRAGQ
jgi:putative heme-binding domain-containing protein